MRRYTRCGLAPASTSRATAWKASPLPSPRWRKKPVSVHSPNSSSSASSAGDPLAQRLQQELHHVGHRGGRGLHPADRAERLPGGVVVDHQHRQADHRRRQARPGGPPWSSPPPRPRPAPESAPEDRCGTGTGSPPLPAGRTVPRRPALPPCPCVPGNGPAPRPRPRCPRRAPRARSPGSGRTASGNSPTAAGTRIIASTAPSGAGRR